MIAAIKAKSVTSCTVKPVYNNHLWDPKRLRHRWSLFIVNNYKILENWGSSLAIVDRWALFRGGR